MKKSISFFCGIMVIFMLMLQSISYGLGNSYTGVQNYEALYKNCSFSDIKNHWAKKSIYKMSALSVIRGMGDSKFYPDKKLTKEEAIILLIRLMGLEDEAQMVGEKLMRELDTGKYTIFSPYDYWIDGYIKVAKSKNIITREELSKILNLSEGQKERIEQAVAEKMDVYMKDPYLTEEQTQNIEIALRKKIERSYTWGQAATREQIAIWVGRMLEIKPIHGEYLQEIYTLRDWKNIKPSYIAMVEAIMKKGIIKGDNKGYFKPKAYITLAEMAAILDKASEQMLIKRGFKIIMGSVENIDTFVTSEQDIVSTKFIGVQNRVFTINNEDHSYTQLVSKESDIDTFDRGFLVYKNGYIGLPKDIRINDYIKYFINEQGEVLFVEVEY
ncbi:hypothetical protein FQB35_13825 [Crassaminicella thermophila]|uniref:SLH domain-containing protein n=1 Tax=Crassaminicella thermophila TaxID=2599308 RepID=A0A5C0SFL4_CRATE|nr:S-layer homology domain-containing protein [Crassaminicella thermophila]QEK13263.1 hypothetical protein FQB35_13825 [Crassaminicella thermophila]